jgi:hypothetical protein
MTGKDQCIDYLRKNDVFKRSMQKMITTSFFGGGERTRIGATVTYLYI